MIAYFDSSALVKRYVAETGSGDVRALLDRATPATSRLSAVEIASALARRCREGHLSASLRDRLLGELDEDLESFYLVEVAPDVVRFASAMLKRNPLRAADAVHLASSLVLQEKLGSPVVFAAFDRNLAAAASREGIETFPAGSDGD